MSDCPYLSDAETRDLTGYCRPKFQARWLQANAIRFYLNAHGKVRIPRDAILKNASKPASHTEPDFSRVKKAG